MTQCRFGIFLPSAPALALSLALMAFAMPSALAQTDAPRGPDQIAAVIAEVIDTVVLIETSENIGGDTGQRDGEVPDLDPEVPLDEFFRDFFQQQERGANRGRPTGEGSGFVIDPQGLIVTNNHVIEASDGIKVTFNDGTKMTAEIVGRDKETDLAVLRVKPSSPLKAVRMGDSDKLQIGEWVVALGNPFGIGLSASSGIISGRNRDIRSGRYDAFIQTDAAINKGNSGGPLFNLNGEVVGVNTAIFSPTGGSVGISFSVPISSARRIIDQLIAHGEVRRGYLGVRIQDVTSELISRIGLDRVRGALVAGVSPGSPAETAGLRPGDVILSVDGTPVTNARTLQRAVGDAGDDRDVAIVILRNRKEETLRVRLGRLEDTSAALDAEDEEHEDGALPDGAIAAFGGVLVPISEELRRQYRIDETVKGTLVVISVDADSPLSAAGIGPGHVLIEAQQATVRDGAAFSKRMEELRAAGKSTMQLLFAAPNGAYRYVTAKLD